MPPCAEVLVIVRGDIGELFQFGIGAGQFLRFLRQQILGSLVFGDVAADSDDSEEVPRTIVPGDLRGGNPPAFATAPDPRLLAIDQRLIGFHDLFFIGPVASSQIGWKKVEVGFPDHFLRSGGRRAPVYGPGLLSTNLPCVSLT